MSLPNGYDSPYDYFKATIHFLREYSWIYQEANTCFLKSKIMDRMPKEFRDYFQQIDTDQLNQFPCVHQALEGLKTNTLVKFRQQLSCLIPAEAFTEPSPSPARIHLKMEQFKKMNVKKQHEIQRLAYVVHEQLNQTEHSPEQRYVLIDVGCGLGYLSEILYKFNENLCILGLESDLYRVEAAEKRLKAYMPQAEHAIHYQHQYITENSKDFINESVEEFLQSNYYNRNATTATTSASSSSPTTMASESFEELVYQHQPVKMAIIGLHACADLTITSMKLFLHMPQVRHLIIMPCCYHKLQMSSTTLKFLNFPLSRSLQEVVLLAENGTESSNLYVSYLNRPFLRLACQQTLKRWQKCSAEQHVVHGREMFLRAVAEALKQKETEVVIKSKIKTDLPSLSGLDFEMFQRLYCLKTSDGTCAEWSGDHQKTFHELMEQYPNGDKLAEGLTCLQTSMQKLCENLVLYDRLCYMQETASELNLNLKVRYEKLMDEELSPRCYVLIAEKL